jgi:hypothetical protein
MHYAADEFAFKDTDNDLVGHLQFGSSLSMLQYDSRIV